MNAPHPPEPVLQCRDLSIAYRTRAGDVLAVDGFDLVVMPGRAVGIVGESGCGKSTVALAIMRYLGGNGRVVSGEILFRGRDLLGMSEAELRSVRGAQIAMVYQEPMASLNPSMRVGRQLMEVPLIHRPGCSGSQARDDARSMLADVGLSDTARMMDAYPHQLSGGQQQRVVIAMALLARPALLLLDEPTTALDVTVEAGIVSLIREIAAKSGTAMIYISHNLGLIRETCEHIAVMYAGEVVETGEVAQVFTGMRHPYTRGLFDAIPRLGADKFVRPLAAIPGQLPLPSERPEGCNFGPRCSHFRAGVCDHGNIAMRPASDRADHGSRCRRFEAIDWAAPSGERAPVDRTAAGATVLRVDALTKHYAVQESSIAALIRGGAVRTVKAAEQLDFDALEAETVAIVGESGCGKSTFAKVLMGLETATAGQITLNDRPLGRLPVEARSPETVGRLQMVFQNPFDTLNPSYTVGAQIARVIRKFGIESDREQIRERVLRLFDTVALPRDFYHRRPRQLSGGQKQRVGIARAFAGEPEVVVADEPVSA
ncbi:MAG: ABC transporter ATP-binding protein, partial [Geminicoccaceae bacterium]|nr:ABC transporter ATP-binding protein [Geminicoccaceae bacterium]